MLTEKSGNELLRTWLLLVLAQSRYTAQPRLTRDNARHSQSETPDNSISHNMRLGLRGTPDTIRGRLYFTVYNTQGPSSSLYQTLMELILRQPQGSVKAV